MDEITLEELLTHYISRIQLALENVDKQRKDIENMSMLIDDELYGEYKDVLVSKLEESLETTKEINTHLEDSLFFLKKQLSEIEEILDEGIPVF